jgi:hypothetical protein
MLRQARRRNAASIAAGHIELEVGDAIKLPAPDNSFDKAFAYTLWERIDSHCCRLHLLCAHGALSSLPREFVGVLLYGGLGLGGAWRFPVLIAFGWATHVAWDLAHCVLCTGLVAGALCRNGSFSRRLHHGNYLEAVTIPLA